jgi:hypothetical protein
MYMQSPTEHISVMCGGEQGVSVTRGEAESLISVAETSLKPIALYSLQVCGQGKLTPLEDRLRDEEQKKVRGDAQTQAHSTFEGKHV